MSVSLAASCLRMANISSCLRRVLALSTSSCSANDKSSTGDFALRSCSFISGMDSESLLGGEEERKGGTCRACGGRRTVARRVGAALLKEAGACLHLGLARKIVARGRPGKGRQVQKGFTTTRMTIAIIRTVGT